VSIITKSDLLADPAGSRFTDILRGGNVHGQHVERWIDFLNTEDRSYRLLVAARDHQTAALKGVLAEAECQPWVTGYFDKQTLRATLRTKMCLGVLVRLHMEGWGWEAAGKKAHLGKRAVNREQEINGQTVILTPKHNGSGFSSYFTMSELYKPAGSPKKWQPTPNHWQSHLSSAPNRGGR